MVIQGPEIESAVVVGMSKPCSVILKSDPPQLEMGAKYVQIRREMIIANHQSQI